MAQAQLWQWQMLCVMQALKRVRLATLTRTVLLQPAGDKAEAQAVKTIFGEAASRVLVSSTKSMIGHLLGAAGAVESIYSIHGAARSGCSANHQLDNPDEGCDLDFVPHEARQVSGMEYTLCNSFGFGGTNGSLIFKRSNLSFSTPYKRSACGPFS